MTPLDLTVLKFINLTIANPVLDFIFKYIGEIKIWGMPLIVIIILLLWKGGPRGRWLVGMSIITAILVDSSIHLIIKPLFARLRPCHADPPITWLRLIAGCGGKYGFPSSHAANLFSQGIVIGTFYKRSQIYLYVIALLVCLSRVYLGVHYPSDVVGGAIYGALIAFILLFVGRFALPKYMANFYWNKKASVTDN